MPLKDEDSSEKPTQNRGLFSKSKGESYYLISVAQSVLGVQKQGAQTVLSCTCWTTHKREGYIIRRTRKLKGYLWSRGGPEKLKTKKFDP